VLSNYVNANIERDHNSLLNNDSNKIAALVLEVVAPS